MRRIQPGSRAAATFALLAALLGASAPLAHAHLDAAQSQASGLCGDHHAPAPAAAGDDCSLCLAGALARSALGARSEALPAAGPTPALRAADPPEPASAAPRAPGGPRAPPQPV